MKRKSATVATRVSSEAPSQSKSAEKAIRIDAEHRAKPVFLDDIRLRAYQKWETAGRPEGDGSRFWIEAEQELLQGM